jgi:3-phosphoshikimate 1-carboxyvinyltransferase
MKKITVHPVSSLQGTLLVPGDKSISHRSVMLGSLAYGTTRVENFLNSADCVSTMNIFRMMGVRIQQKGNTLTIHGKGLNSLKPPKKTLNAGNSGTTARIILGILAGQPFTSRLTGDKYLRRRPMKRVVEPLLQMHARISGEGDGNWLPLKVETRKLLGATYRLPVASAQVKSSILMAGLFAKGQTRVVEPTPSRDHTERMFSAFGIPFEETKNSITVYGPVKPFKGRKILVPSDISSAAFFIVAGLITPNSRLLLKNIGVNPTRTGLLDVLKKMGGRITVYPKKTVKGGEPVADILVESSRLKALVLDDEKLIPRMVDEFPILAVAASQAHGKTVVKNASELKVKESDRILMMAITLKKMGADIQPTTDGWIINGPTALTGCALSSAGDHRIAMSLAVAALIAKGATTILDTENINTSFPGFEALLKKVSKHR